MSQPTEARTGHPEQRLSQEALLARGFQWIIFPGDPDTTQTASGLLVHTHQGGMAYMHARGNNAGRIVGNRAFSLGVTSLTTFGGEMTDSAYPKLTFTFDGDEEERHTRVVATRPFEVVSAALKRLSNETDDVEPLIVPFPSDELATYFGRKGIPYDLLRVSFGAAALSELTIPVDPEELLRRYHEIDRLLRNEFNPSLVSQLPQVRDPDGNTLYFAGAYGVSTGEDPEDPLEDRLRQKFSDYDLVRADGVYVGVDDKGKATLSGNPNVVSFAFKSKAPI